MDNKYEKKVDLPLRGKPGRRALEDFRAVLRENLITWTA